MNDEIRNQEINHTVIIPDLLTGASVGTWQADYPLTGRDYEHLKNGKPVTFNWANSILLTTIGFGLSLLSKALSRLAGVQQEIYVGEWYAFGLGILASILLYAIGFCLPNDRKKLMKKLQQHFDNAPKKRQIVREG